MEALGPPRQAPTATVAGSEMISYLHPLNSYNSHRRSVQEYTSLFHL